MDGQYINRLIDCGFSPCNAFLIYYQFLNKYHFSHKEIEDYLDSLEKDHSMRGIPLCG